MLFGSFLSHTSVFPYTFPVEQGPSTDQEDLAISVFPLQATRTCPFFFPRLRLNHHSRLRSNHLGGWQRKYTSLLHGDPFLKVGRAAFFRSCISVHSPIGVDASYLWEGQIKDLLFWLIQEADTFPIYSKYKVVLGQAGTWKCRENYSMLYKSFSVDFIVVLYS